MTNPFLIEAPRRVHRFWWTCLPALPASAQSHAYRALRRLWHDHTLNTFRQHADGSWLANARGYYIEGTEDNLTPALFETFNALPAPTWVAELARQIGVQTAGTINRARWCYAFEDPNASRGFRIADIVLTWEDDAGRAVLVVEAKRPGVMPGTKDLPEGTPYLQMPALRQYSRRHYCLLVGDAERPAVERLTQDRQKVVTWLDLLAIQMNAAESAAGSAEIRCLLQDAIEWNFGRFGIGETPARETYAGAAGSQAAYDRLRKLGMPTAVEQFLIGTESCAVAHRGIMPEPPFEYLRAEPTSLDTYVNGKKHATGYQTTGDRRIPHWRLDGPS